MKPIFNFCVIVIAGLISFTSCKKNDVEQTKKTPAVTLGPGADFTTSGDLYINNQIKFNSDAQAGTKLTWYFGDGDASQEVSPVHQYPYDSTYIVRLLVNGITTTKSIKITPSSERIKQISNWTRTYCRQIYNDPDSIIDIKDTSFVLDIPDEYRIILPAEYITGFKDTISVHYDKFDATTETNNYKSLLDPYYFGAQLSHNYKYGKVTFTRVYTVQVQQDQYRYKLIYTSK